MNIRLLVSVLLLGWAVLPACFRSPTQAPTAGPTQGPVHGRTLEEWGRTPIEATLTPLGSLEATHTLVLEVRNIFDAPVEVKRIALLQVGPRDGMTVAHQPLEDAAQVTWNLQPGEARTFQFDLDELKFEALDGKQDIAWKYVSAIPEGERKLSVSVLHTSRMWPGGMDSVVRYPP